MAAPSGIQWGSTVGGYGRIGIYVALSQETDTTLKYTVETWFWSKYSVDDSNNNFYIDRTSTSSGTASEEIGSLNISTGDDSGSGWSTSNQKKIHSYSPTFDRRTADYTVYFKSRLTNIDRVGGEMTCSRPWGIAAIPKYTITFDANGGTGAPVSISQFKNANVTISTTKPTRTGYTFKGWGTSATAATATYQPGATITTRTNTKLYAVWTALTYSVKFDANGGTGAPATQTKTHGTALTLSSTQPTRNGYNFKGWGLSATSTTATYQRGGSYTNNSAATLYAVWEINYKIPIIYNLVANRCDSNGALKEDGTYALVSFNWACFYDVQTVSFAWSSPSAGTGSQAVAASGKSGSVSAVIGNGGLNAETTYSITVTVADSGGNTSSTTTLPGAIFPMDVLAGGKGISFGKNAELENTAEFAFDAKFNKPVYGKALGMDRLPAIPANSDFNVYRETGCYAVQSNAIAETCVNIPVKRAGRLEVWASTGEGVRSAQFSYLRQRFIPYNSPNAVYERDITRGAENDWAAGDWWRSSLTPNASAKVYHEQKVLWGDDLASGMYMTAGHTATLTEKVSEQANGIILVFCYYNGANDTNWGWITRFIPKIMVELAPGEGHTIELTNGKFGSVGTKYLYINDGSISGHADNNLTGTSGSGITYANNKFVLRYVIGV